MKILKLSLCLLLTLLVPRFASALIRGPYTTDASTLHLYHFDETAVPCIDAAASTATNLTYLINGAALGSASYSTTGNNFTNCISFGTLTTSNSVIFPIGSGNVGTAIPFTYAGASGAFTYEALVHIQFNTTNYFRAQPCQIFNCDADSTGTRALQFRLCPVGFLGGWASSGFNNTNVVRIEFINGTSTVGMAPIPTNGVDAIITNNWYHVAVTYNGTPNTTSNLLFYWTLLDPSRTSADCIWGTNMAANLPGTYTDTTIFSVGNGARNPSGGTGPAVANFLGQIDELRISSVARAANQMMFAPATVTLVQEPIGQEGVDYGDTGILSVGASSGVALGYQWFQNSLGLSGATNAIYIFTNANAGNAGNYFCVVTNANGSSATSTLASVVIGAANYLTNRYSFTSDASDSIGGQNGTVEGGATFNGNGTLTLDGSSGFVQLPTNMINTNMGAITMETWASFGTISANSMLFAFGNTNGTSGYNYIFATPHGATARMAITAGTYTSEQGATSGGALDNENNVQIVCVFAPYENTETFYTNGVLAAVNTNATLPLASIIDNFSYLGHSLFSADPYLAGTLDEFRIYNGELSAASVKQSYLQGSTNILSDGPVAILDSPANVATAQNLPVTFTVVASGHQPISYQWLKNGLPIAGATNSSYTYSPTFADNNASFQLLATNTVGGSIYSAASGTASLSVSVPATLTWYNNSQDGAWNLTSGNWNAGGVDYAQFDGVVFNDSDANNSTPGATIDLQFAASPLGVTVSNTVDSYEITSYSADGALTVLGTLVKEGPGSLTLDVTNNSTGPVEVLGGTLQIGNGDTYGSLGSGPVTNNGALVFDRSDSIGVANDLHGTGSVVLNSGMITPTSTNNDYAGGTTINAGVIYAGNSESLGAANGGVVVNSGGQLYITGNVNFGVKPISLNGTGDGNGALRKGGAGATAYAGPVTLADDTTIGVDSGATLTLSNTISGNAALTAVGTGTMALDTTNSFSGGFTLNGPVIDLNANQALGPGLVTVSGTGRLVLASGLTFTNEVIASTVSPGVATGLLMVNDNTNGIVTTVSGPLEFDATPANGSDFYGPTSSGYLNITGSITNLSSGVVGARNGFVRFSGGGNYATFNLNQGTTSLGANNGLSTNATLSIGASGAATLDLNGFNQALTGLANGAANAELITNSGASQSTLTLDLSSSSSFMGTIAGNIALVETGSGSLDLTGTNSYTGDTTVSGGTLEIGQPTFAARSTVTVASGATLQMDFTTTNTVAALVLNGVSQPLGLYNASSSPSYLNGSGSLLVAVTVATYPTNLIAKVSNGSLTLSWPADHTGWRLLTQTNSLATGLVTSTNNWSTVANSANTNVVNVTIDPTQPAVFYRMVYP